MTFIEKLDVLVKERNICLQVRDNVVKIIIDIDLKTFCPTYSKLQMHGSKVETDNIQLIFTGLSTDTHFIIYDNYVKFIHVDYVEYFSDYETISFDETSKRIKRLMGS